MEIQRAEVLVRSHTADFAGRHSVCNENIVIHIEMSGNATHLNCEMVAVHESTVADDDIALDIAPEERFADWSAAHLRNRRILALNQKTSCLAALRRTCAGVVRSIAAIAVVLPLVECDSVDEDSRAAFSAYINLKAGVAAACSDLLCARTDGCDVLHRVTLGEIAVPASYEREILLHFNKALVEFAEVVALRDVDYRTFFCEVNRLLEVLHCGLWSQRIIAVRAGRADIVAFSRCLRGSGCGLVLCHSCGPFIFFHRVLCLVNQSVQLG